MEVEPELVEEPVEEPVLDRELELEVEDDLPDEEEVVLDLRLAELTVPLVPVEPLPAEPVEPVGRGFMMGVTKVEFWPAGTIAAED